MLKKPLLGFAQDPIGLSKILSSDFWTLFLSPVSKSFRIFFRPFLGLQKFLLDAFHIPVVMTPTLYWILHLSTLPQDPFIVTLLEFLYPAAATQINL